jgi:hypothetical protein
MRAEKMDFTKRLRRIALAAAALTALALPAATPVAAKSYHDAIRDCFDDGQLEGHYTRHQLQQALRHLPGDEAEYSDCRDVLRRAMIPSGGGGSLGGGASPAIPGNPSLATPSGAQAGSQQDFNNLQRQTAKPGASGPPKLSVGGHGVTPGDGGVLSSAHVGPNKLPTSLLASLIGLGVLSAIAGILVIRRRWPETRRVALRLLRR